MHEIEKTLSGITAASKRLNAITDRILKAVRDVEKHIHGCSIGGQVTVDCGDTGYRLRWEKCRIEIGRDDVFKPFAEWHRDARLSSFQFVPHLVIAIHKYIESLLTKADEIRLTLNECGQTLDENGALKP